MQSPGSGKEPAQPEEEPGTLRDARVAPDWLGERGAGARETRTQSQRDARQKQSPAELGASSFVSTSGRLSGPRSHSPERMRKGLSTRGHSWNPPRSAGRSPERAREPGVSLESCMGGRTESPPWAKEVYPVLPHLPACFHGRLALLEDFRLSCALGSTLLVYMTVLNEHRSLQQSILSVDIWLLFLPLSCGFLSSSPRSLLLNEKHQS